MKKMGKYAESIGVWKHEIDGITHSIVPRMGDNEKLNKIFQAQGKTKDNVQMFRDVRNFYYELVTRNDNTLTETDQEELQLFIEMNQNKILEDLMIQFKWSTKEEMDKQKEKLLGDSQKNL